MSEEKIKEFLKYKIGLQIRFNQKYEEIFESLFSELCDFSRRNISPLNEIETEYIRDRLGITSGNIETYAAMSKKYSINDKEIKRDVTNAYNKICRYLRNEYYNSISKEEILNLKVSDLNISYYAKRKVACIDTSLKYFINHTKNELMGPRYDIKEEFINEIEEALKEVGLSLRKDSILTPEEFKSLTVEEQQSRPIKDLDIPPYIKDNFPLQININTVKDLTEVKKEDLLFSWGIGKKRYLEIREALNKYALDIKASNSLETEKREEQMIEAKKKGRRTLNILLNDTSFPVSRDQDINGIYRMLEDYSKSTILNLNALETCILRKRLLPNSAIEFSSFSAIAQELNISNRAVEESFYEGISKLRKALEEKRILKDAKEKRKELKNELKILRSLMKRKKEEVERLELECTKKNKEINEYTRILNRDFD